MFLDSTKKYKEYLKYNMDRRYEEMIDRMISVIENYLLRASPTET